MNCIWTLSVKDTIKPRSWRCPNNSSWLYTLTICYDTVEQQWCIIAVWLMVSAPPCQLFLFPEWSTLLIIAKLAILVFSHGRCNIVYALTLESKENKVLNSLLSYESVFSLCDKKTTFHGLYSCIVWNQVPLGSYGFTAKSLYLIFCSFERMSYNKTFN